MELVVNTNRIIAALIKKGSSREIILSRKFSLYTIDFGVKEVRKYESLIRKKAKITKKEFNFLMNALMSKIIVVSKEEISKKAVKQAVNIMRQIDADDVPFIALSIHLKGMLIWSDDKHFKQQKKIKVLTTKQLAKTL